jgi:rod shape-determining protein MreC
MRNLIAFYLRFRLFLVFAILQAIALYTYFTYSDFPRLQMLTTAGTVNAKVLEVRNDVTKHFNLAQTNRQMMWENKRLREKLTQSLYQENQGVVTVDDSVFHQQYSYIPADVINNTYDKRNNYMTINIGRNHGIKKGWGVCSSKGVVGTVEIVGEHYSVVRTILTANSNLDVTLEKGGAFGLLKWDGLSPRIISISGISNDIPIKNGRVSSLVANRASSRVAFSSEKYKAAASSRAGRCGMCAYCWPKISGRSSMCMS